MVRWLAAIDRGFGFITLNPSARPRRLAAGATGRILRDGSAEITGDGTGRRCPPLPESCYAPDAVPLDTSGISEA